MSEKREISDLIRGKLGAGLMNGLGLLPLSVNRRIGSCVGLMAWWAKGKSVQTCLENIEKCFPEKTEEERQALARQSMIETARTVFESFSLWCQPYERQLHYILKVHGEELLPSDGHDENTPGTLMLVPHLGCWEIMGGFLAKGRNPIYMYEPTGTPEIDELMKYGREHVGAILAPTNRSGVSMVLKHLKKGDLVVILPDQVPDRNSGVVAPFFGNPALTMTLVQKLAQRTQCKLLLGFSKRVPRGFEFIYKQASDLIASEDLVESATAMNKDVEDLVMLAPEQYQWEYKRFRRVPKEM